jgi:hypothetical protein
MERGSDKNSPRQDDLLAAELAGQYGSRGSNREEWADPEPPADDDPDVALTGRVGDPRTDGTTTTAYSTGTTTADDGAGEPA